MNFDVKIDCRALFNECVDQTLLDYRNRTTEAGQSMTATHTLELSLLDAFMFNLQSVAEALRARISRTAVIHSRPAVIPYARYSRHGPGSNSHPHKRRAEIRDAHVVVWW